jgi:hypothetical protein
MAWCSVKKESLLYFISAGYERGILDFSRKVTVDLYWLVYGKVKDKTCIVYVQYVKADTLSFVKI